MEGSHRRAHSSTSRTLRHTHTRTRRSSTTSTMLPSSWSVVLVFLVANICLGLAVTAREIDGGGDNSDNWLAFILNNQDAETRDSLGGDQQQQQQQQQQLAVDNNPSTSRAEAKNREYHVCVTLNPSRVSSRNGPYVTYECFAQICSDDIETAAPATVASDSLEEYRFQRPLFDWNSQFSHLVVNNGTCAADGLTCWNRIELNVDTFLDSMESTGVPDLEVRCRVADYTRNYEGYNFVTGEGVSVLRHFKGIAVHEPCNRTEDCGENLICVPPSSDSESEAVRKAYGYCECTTTTIESGEINATGNGKEKIRARSFVLAEDEDFRELMCLEVAKLNQTCRHDQQCRAADPESACRPPATFGSSGSSVCDCTYALDPAGSFPRCLASPSSANNSDYAIWWFFPPVGSGDSGSAFYYYTHRYQALYRIASVFLVFIFMFLLVAIMVAIVICITRHRHATTRQYSPRRMSEISTATTVPVSDQSFYFPEVATTTPATPTTEKPPRPLEVFRTTPMGLSLDVFGSSNNKKSHKEDKLDLVDHDQLDGGHEDKFP